MISVAGSSLYKALHFIFILFYIFILSVFLLFGLPFHFETTLIVIKDFPYIEWKLYLHSLILFYRYTIILSQKYFLDIWKKKKKVSYFLQISGGKMCPILQFLFSSYPITFCQTLVLLQNTPVVNTPLKVFQRTEHSSPDAVKSVKIALYIMCT